MEIAVEERINGAVAQERRQATKIGAELPIGISAFGAWMIGVGSIIGSMAWLFHGPMIAKAGTLAAFTAWIIAGIAMLPLTLILMELSSMFPTAGGPYVYKFYALKRLIPGMGEMLGFLTGWLFWVCMLVGLACMANGLTNLLCSCIWGSAKAGPIWFGPLVIAVLFIASTFLNRQKIKGAARLSNIFTIMKFAMALSFAALVIFSPAARLANVWHGYTPAGNNNLFTNVLSVLMFALAGFSGIEMAGCTASETAGAKRSVPFSILWTLGTITLIYCSMCLAVGAASQYVVSPDKTTMVIPGSNIQATCPAIAGFLGGSLAGQLFTVCVVISIVGCGFVALLGTARVAYSMAHTGLFPKQFAQLESKTKVPEYSLYFQMWILIAISIIANVMARTGIFTDAYAFLGEAFGFLYAFMAIIYAVSIVGLRYTDADMERPIKIGRGNALVWILALFTALIWGYAAFACISWTSQLAGLLILLSGIPIYMHHKKHALN